MYNIIYDIYVIYDIYQGANILQKKLILYHFIFTIDNKYYKQIYVLIQVKFAKKLDLVVCLFVCFQCQVLKTGNYIKYGIRYPYFLFL